MYDTDGERVWQLQPPINGLARFDRWTLRGLDAKVRRTFELYGYAWGNGWGGSNLWEDYVYRGGPLLASYSSDGYQRHVDVDHLGTPRLIKRPDSGQGGGFYTLTPCRILDTRQTAAPLTQINPQRVYQLSGACGVPANAQSSSWRCSSGSAGRRWPGGRRRTACPRWGRSGGPAMPVPPRPDRAPVAAARPEPAAEAVPAAAYESRLSGAARLLARAEEDRELAAELLRMEPLARIAAAGSEPRFHRPSLVRLLALEVEAALEDPARDPRPAAELGATLAAAVPRDAQGKALRAAAWAWWLFGKALLRACQGRLAKSAFEAMEAFIPRHWPAEEAALAAAGLGQAWENAGEVDAAEAQLLFAAYTYAKLDADTQSASCYAQAGFARYESGKLEDAAPALRAAIERLDPAFAPSLAARLWLALAEIETTLQRRAAAAECLDRARALYPLARTAAEKLDRTWAIHFFLAERLALATLATSLAIYCHLAGYATVPAGVLVAALLCRRWRSLLLVGAATAALTAPYTFHLLRYRSWYRGERGHVALELAPLIYLLAVPGVVWLLRRPKDHVFLLAWFAAPVAWLFQDYTRFLAQATLSMSVIGGIWAARVRLWLSERTPRSARTRSNPSCGGSGW